MSFLDDFDDDNDEIIDNSNFADIQSFYPLHIVLIKGSKNYTIQYPDNTGVDWKSRIRKSNFRFNKIVFISNDQYNYPHCGHYVSIDINNDTRFEDDIKNLPIETRLKLLFILAYESDILWNSYKSDDINKEYHIPKAISKYEFMWKKSFTNIYCESIARLVLYSPCNFRNLKESDFNNYSSLDFRTFAISYKFSTGEISVSREELLPESQPDYVFECEEMRKKYIFKVNEYLVNNSSIKMQFGYATIETRENAADASSGITREKYMLGSNNKKFSRSSIIPVFISAWANQEGLEGMTLNETYDNLKKVFPASLRRGNGKSRTEIIHDERPKNKYQEIKVGSYSFYVETNIWYKDNFLKFLEIADGLAKNNPNLKITKVD